MLEQSPGIEVLPVRNSAGLGAGVGGRGGGRAALMGDDGAGYRAKAKQSDGKGVSMGVTMDAVSNPSVDGLQKALEAEVVNHLKIQNSQLMEEVEKLKAMMSQSGKGSNASWSKVGG